MQKKSINYSASLLIGLLSLNTLSSCGNTGKELGMVLVPQSTGMSSFAGGGQTSHGPIPMGLNSLALSPTDMVRPKLDNAHITLTAALQNPLFRRRVVGKCAQVINSKNFTPHKFKVQGTSWLKDCSKEDLMKGVIDRGDLHMFVSLFGSKSPCREEGCNLKGLLAYAKMVHKKNKKNKKNNNGVENIITILEAMVSMNS